MALAPGVRLGAYEILSLLGAGGMGEVYKARDTRLDRAVAIKVLAPEIAGDPDLRARFEREARAVAALDHPHICGIYDVGEANGTHFIVMPYLEGQTLAARLEKGALPLDQVLKIATEIAGALDKAHRHGIVHRDFKPANIMLTKAGSKLLDFGLAKLKKPAGPISMSGDPERLQRFEQEARAAAALNHPNILAVHDIGQHDGAPYIVSELLEGETLRERLNGGALPVRKAVESAIQIAYGLAAAHEKGITHRDLKPENVFVTSDGRVKILNFGLAKLTQAEPPLVGVSELPTTPPNTLPGVVLGTIGYMAPEQVRGLAADRRSDIFAFGGASSESWRVQWETNPPGQQSDAL